VSLIKYRLLEQIAQQTGARRTVKVIVRSRGRIDLLFVIERLDIALNDDFFLAGKLVRARRDFNATIPGAR